MKVENIHKAKEIINSIEDIDKFLDKINIGSIIALVDSNNNNIATIENEDTINAIVHTLYNERERLLTVIKEL